MFGGQRGWLRLEAVLRRLTGSLLSGRVSPPTIGALEARLDGHTAAKVMASMLGIATNNLARLIATIGDGGGFRTADQLAAIAGLAAVTRQSGTSINSQRHDRRGNRRIKNVFFNAALSALILDPNSRRYYDKNAPRASTTQRRCFVLPDDG